MLGLLSQKAIPLAFRNYIKTVNGSIENSFKDINREDWSFPEQETKRALNTFATVWFLSCAPNLT